MTRRLLLLGALLVSAFFTPLAAQTARDSAFATKARADLDSMARDKTAPQYSKRAQTRLRARVDSLLRPIAPANRAPVAVFTYPLAGCKVGDICTFDASASTDDKAVVSYQWDCGVTPNCNSTGKTASAVYTVAGTPVVTLKVTDAEGLSSTVQRSIPIVAPDTLIQPTDSASPAELPRTYLRDAYPVAVRSVPVPAGWNLQDALNAAQAGDQIVLVTGASYVGNFQWTRCLTGWVTVVTGGVDLPEGSRATPTIAASFAKLVSPNVAPVLVSRNGGCKLWGSRLELTATAQSSSVNYNYGLVRLGEDETTLAQQPSDIVLERVYIHGTPTTSTQNAVIMNARRLTLKDSWVSEVHWPGTESHCVVGWAGTGPFRVTNNTLSCASINVLFGGAEPVIAGLYSGDVEIRGNHVTKDPKWQLSDGFVVKNLLEFKNARRVVVEGNVLEMTPWSNNQGMAINAQSLSDANQPAQTADLTFRYNRVTGGNRCFTLLAHGWNGSGTAMARVVVEQNLCTELGDSETNTVMLLGGDLHDLVIRHNTMVRKPTPYGTAFAVERNGGPAAVGVRVTDNLYGSGNPYGCAFASGGLFDAAAWADFGGGTAVVSGNVCWDDQGPRTPTGNAFPSSLTAVGFAADWSLSLTSPFKGKASDGKDPGADIPELTRRTAGVVVP